MLESDSILRSFAKGVQVRRSSLVPFAPLLVVLGGALPIPSAVAAVIHQYSAETTATARRQGAVSVSGMDWNCKGARCVSSGTWARPTVDACHSLAQRVGPVRSYGRKGLVLSRDELRECNVGVPAAEPASADRRTRSITPDDFVLLTGPLPNTPERVIVSPHSDPAGPGGKPIKLPPLPTPVSIDAGTLRYSGNASVFVDAGTLRHAGNESISIDAGTLRYPAGPP